MYALPLADGSADSAIIHQVLHYAHSPAAAVAEAARVCEPRRNPAGGRFAAHECEELRSSDAHIRLGFDDEVMPAGSPRPGSRSPCEHLEGGS